MRKNHLNKLLAAGAVLLSVGLTGCGGAMSDSTVKTFVNADAEDIEYAYTVPSGSSVTVSDYMTISSSDDSDLSFVTETISDLQEALQDDELTETDDDLPNSDLVFVFRMSDNSILYLYNDGSIKTVDTDINRTQYHGDDDLKEVGEDAAERLSDWLADQQ